MKPRPKRSMLPNKMREVECLKLKQHGLTWQQVATELNMSPSGAHDAAARAIRRERAPLVAQVRESEYATYQAIREKLWPIAMADPELVFATNVDGEPVVDDEGRRVVYAVIPKHQLDAIDRVFVASEKIVNLFGAKHSDVVAEQELKLKAAQVLLLRDSVNRGLAAAQLTEEQQAAFMGAMAQELERIETDG